MNNLFDGITSRDVCHDCFNACDWFVVTNAGLSLVNTETDLNPKSHALLFGKYLLRASLSGHQQIIISIFVRKFQCDACSDGVWCMDVWINWTMNMCIQCSIYYLNSMVYFEQDIIDKSSRLLKNSNENILILHRPLSNAMYLFSR